MFVCLEHRTIRVIWPELFGWMDAIQLPRWMDADELLGTILEDGSKRPVRVGRISRS